MRGSDPREERRRRDERADAATGTDAGCGAIAAWAARLSRPKGAARIWPTIALRPKPWLAATTLCAVAAILAMPTIDAAAAERLLGEVAHEMRTPLTVIDGTVEQHQDTAYRAAADLQGNDNTVSIETWDAYRESAPNKPIPYDGNGVSGWRSTSDVPAWTDKQITALIALLQWLWKTHPSIPRKLATDSKIGTSSHGVAWHKLGVPSTSGATVSQTGGML